MARVVPATTAAAGSTAAIKSSFYESPQALAEQRYRNPMSEVQDFFQAYHPRHSMVVNLCCERGYAATEFEHAVAFPFMDRECRAGSGCDCRPRL